MTNEELKKVLELHKLWLNDDVEGERADLRNANLCNADLRNEDLCNANLSNVDLRYADLQGADLRYADLRYADLSDADLHGADLCDADLHGANLSQANTNGVKGLKIYSIDNVGTYNGKITYTPSLNTVYAGCWTGTAEEFFVKCKEVIEENDEDLNLDIALNMIQQLYDKYHS